MPLSQLPGPLTGNLQGDLSIVLFVIGILVALRLLDRRLNRPRRAMLLGLAPVLMITAVLLFVNALNAQNAQYANVPVDSVQAAAGQSVYEENCLSCHGATGHGDGPAAASMTVKPLDLTVHIYQHDQAYFLLVVGGGMGPMPAFKDKLTGQQIEDVIAYVRLLARQTQH